MDRRPDATVAAIAAFAVNGISILVHNHIRLMVRANPTIIFTIIHVRMIHHCGRSGIDALQSACKLAPKYVSRLECTALQDTFIILARLVVGARQAPVGLTFHEVVMQEVISMHSSQSSVVHMPMCINETRCDDFVSAVDHFHTTGWCDVWCDLSDPVTVNEDIRLHTVDIISSVVDNNNAILEQYFRRHCVSPKGHCSRT